LFDSPSFHALYDEEQRKYVCHIYGDFCITKGERPLMHTTAGPSIKLALHNAKSWAAKRVRK